MRDGSGSSSSLFPYLLLPSLIQRRMPKFRTLGRPFSQYQTTTCCTPAYDQPSAESFTPPPSYSLDVENAPLFDKQPIALSMLPNRISGVPSRPSSSGSATPSLSGQDSRSGVRWKYADPGFTMLSFAAEEASAANLSPSPNLIRTQYINGVACMLKGLPADITEEEEACIREALSTTIRGGVAHQPEHATLIRALKRSGQRPATHESALHRAVSGLTFYMFFVVVFVLPYLQLFLRTAYEYDRKNKVTDRMMANVVLAADAVSKRALTLAQQVCALNDGKIGHVVKDTGIYLVQGLSGGVYDGLGEAMRIRASGVSARHRGNDEKAEQR